MGVLEDSFTRAHATAVPGGRLERATKVAAVGLAVLGMLMAAALSHGAEAPESLLGTITVCEEGCDYQLVQHALDAAGVGDTIFVGEGVFEENLTIGMSVRLRGIETERTVIDAGAGTGIAILPGAGAVISDLTVRGGGGPTGGGILNQGSLTLRRALITESGDAEGDTYGGAIYNYGGTVVIEDSRLEGNQARYGGAVFNVGFLFIQSSQLVGNDGREGGGAVLNFSGTTLVNNSILAENEVSAVGSGGAIFNNDTLAVANSALTGNSSTEFGGAIFQVTGGSYVTNSTFSANEAAYGGGGIYTVRGETVVSSASLIGNKGLTGGALYNNEGWFYVRNSIVAQSPGTGCFGEINSQGYNIDGGNSCGFAEDGDLSNTSPMVEPLADNGGFTPTHALQPGSPAIDAADLVGCTDYNFYELTTDQRGYARSVDGDGDGDARCDIGAFEYDPDGGGPAPTPTPGPVPRDVTVCPVGCEHSSIQAGIDAAAAGQVVGVGGGEYAESLVIDKPITLKGAGAGATTIVGEAGMVAIDLLDGATEATLEGLHVTGGEGVRAAAGELEIKGVEIDFSTSLERGGLFKGGGVLSVEDSTVSSNVSLGPGGGVGAIDTEVTIRRSTVTGNSSAGDGGGIWVSGGELLLDTVSISGNEGQNGGGLAVVGGFPVEIRGGTISGNLAEYGGGVFSRRPIVANGLRFVRNQAEFGGGVYSMASFAMTGGELRENVATGEFGYGGGAFVDGDEATFDRVAFEANQAAVGGAVYSRGSAILDGGTASGNQAWFGGAFYVTRGILSAAETTVSGNVAQRNGGAAYVDREGELELESAILTENSSEGEGGAVFARDSGEVTLLQSEISGNTAGSGGGLALAVGDGETPRLTAQESSISFNEASGLLLDEEDPPPSGFGGGIYVGAGEAELQGVTLAGNEALRGGAMSITSTAAARLINTTLSDNAASEGGGGMHVAGSLEAAYTTMAVNVADADALGGAAILAETGSSVDLRGSILGTGVGADACAGAVRSSGHNLDEDGSCGLDATDDVSGLDAMLRALASNGGRVRTHALRESSAAVDLVPPEACTDLEGVSLDADARGAARPADGNGDGTAACDAGAFEIDPDYVPEPTPTPTPRVTPGPGRPSVIYMPRAARDG